MVGGRDKMTSVTTVLGYMTDPILLGWFLNKGKAACKKIGDEAKRVGSAVDKMVQEDILGRGYVVPENEPEIASCMSAWEKFKKDFPEFVPSVKVMQVELVDGEVVGHPDFVISRPTGCGIVDLKTSKAIHPNYWTQTAKYGQMALKMGIMPDFSFIAVLRLDKVSGAYEYREIAEKSQVDEEIMVFEAYWKIFQHNFNIREVLRQQLEEEVLNG